VDDPDLTGPTGNVETARLLALDEDNRELGVLIIGLVVLVLGLVLRLEEGLLLLQSPTGGRELIHARAGVDTAQKRHILRNNFTQPNIGSRLLTSSPVHHGRL